MSWSGLSTNETVTFTDAADAVSTSVFTALNSFSSTLACMTKSDALYYLNIGNSYAPFSALYLNELVIKSNLVAPTSYLTRIVYDTPGDAAFCYSSGGTLSLYFNTSQTIVYTDTALTTTFNGQSKWWYCEALNLTYRIASDGQITAIHNCSA